MTSVATAETAGLRGRPRSRAADRAILDATMRLLGEGGFAGTTMTAIARSAGVSTATLYRRYSSRESVVIDALSRQIEHHRMPDTGALDSDLRAWLRFLIKRLTHPSGARLVAALLDESTRNSEMAIALYEHVSRPLRDDVSAMFERAIDRGEMRSDVDLELAIDLAIGPIYLRRLESVRSVDAGLADRLTDMVLGAVATQPSDSTSPTDDGDRA